MIIKKKLPIGIEFFQDFKRDDFYYVDKTGFIRDLIDFIIMGSLQSGLYWPDCSDKIYL